MPAVKIQPRVNILNVLWGDDTDYDSRAMFIINRMEQKIRERSLDDPAEFRRMAVGKLVDIIIAEGTDASRREIAALQKQYSRIYPDLKDIITIPRA